MLLLLLLTGAARPCEPQTLRVRTTQPVDGQVDVPLDARMAVSLIGWGTAEEVEVTLLAAGVPVEVERTAWCYEHEGPTEVHCWWSLRPTAPLAADAEHQLRIDSTKAWSGDGDWRMDVRFWTGSALAEPLSGTPGLRVLEAWDELADDACDYAQARRYRLWLEPASGVGDPSALSLFHLSEVDAHGAASAVVHSVFVNNPGDPDAVGMEIKQFLDGAVPRSDCFSLVQESPAGARSEAVTACVETEADTGGDGGADTGSTDPGDGGDADGGADGEPDSGAPGADGGALGGTPDGSGSPPRCAGCGGAGAALVLPAWLATRRSGGRRRSRLS